MQQYRPKKPFTVPMRCLKPTKKTSMGAEVKSYSDDDAFDIFGSFSTYGGSEHMVNDVILVEDTAIIETWYRPDITADCRIKEGGKTYEIITPPEDIEKRHIFLRFKVRALTGGA